ASPELPTSAIRLPGCALSSVTSRATSEPSSLVPCQAGSVSVVDATYFGRVLSLCAIWSFSSVIVGQTAAKISYVMRPRGEASTVWTDSLMSGRCRARTGRPPRRARTRHRGPRQRVPELAPRRRGRRIRWRQVFSSGEELPQGGGYCLRRGVVWLIGQGAALRVGDDAGDRVCSA